MVRTMPVVHNEEIELYIRTYYSLLRSSAPVRIRSLEETHAAMNSSLHQQAGSLDIDTSALVYSALRLPDCILETKLMVMGQMEDVFIREGYNVIEWQPVKARAAGVNSTSTRPVAFSPPMWPALAISTI